MQTIYIVLAVILLCWGFSRCVILSVHKGLYYLGRDIYEYFKYKKWKNFNLYGIDMFVGMFGHGKTLTMTHRARMIYKAYGDSILFLSNYELKGIPYKPLINFNQLVDLSIDEVGHYQGIVVMIDEIEDYLSHRNYASFPLQLLNTLTQQRKLHIYIMCSAQRYFMVDKLFRCITTHVIDCNKYWRYQHETYYDAWDYENAMNTQLLKPYRSNWWFVSNKDFDAYDTSQMLDRNASEMFLSNEESIVRLGLDATVNEQAIQKPSKSLRRQRRTKKSA